MNITDNDLVRTDRSAVTVPAPRAVPAGDAPAGATGPGGAGAAATEPISTVPAVDATLLPDPCRCGHGLEAHEHFRAGRDCSACGCARYRRPSLLARLRG